MRRRSLSSVWRSRCWWAPTQARPPTWRDLPFRYVTHGHVMPRGPVQHRPHHACSFKSDFPPVEIKFEHPDKQVRSALNPSHFLHAEGLDDVPFNILEPFEADPALVSFLHLARRL